MSLYTYISIGYVRKKRALLMLAVLALIFFQVATAAAQPSGDSLNRPPASTQLAFVRDDQIYLINADGTGLIQLTDTETGVVNSDPAWSRDGQRLAFARGTLVGGSQENWGIYIMDADGSNVIQLTHEGYNIEPSWGPNDLSIVFTGRPSVSYGSVGLWLIDLDTASSQGSRVLFDFPGWDAHPAWSPDGQTIMFSSDHRAYDIMFDLYAMNVDGSDIRPLLQGPFFAADGPIEYYQSAWSPDGQNIAVVSCLYAWDSCYTLPSTITVANSDGSDQREIALAGSFASPTWSPDGRWIAFGSAACRTCESSLRFVRVDGSIEGLLINDGHSPAWQPDPDTQNAPDDPDGPIKEPDEPKDPEEPRKPLRIKLPECGSKCVNKSKLTGAHIPDEH